MIALAVIEHTPIRRPFSSTCARFLREGGKVVRSRRPIPWLSGCHGVGRQVRSAEPTKRTTMISRWWREGASSRRPRRRRACRSRRIPLLQCWEPTSSWYCRVTAKRRPDFIAHMSLAGQRDAVGADGWPSSRPVRAVAVASPSTRRNCGGHWPRAANFTRFLFDASTRRGSTRQGWEPGPGELSDRKSLRTGCAESVYLGRGGAFHRRARLRSGSHQLVDAVLGTGFCADGAHAARAACRSR